jgi:hypothetical protein
MYSRLMIDQILLSRISHVLVRSLMLLVLGIVPISTKAQESSQLIMKLKVNSIKLNQVSMQNALKQLQSKDAEKILIGFEEIPHQEGKQQKLISLELSNATVGTILRKLVTIDPRYTYEVTKEGIINIFPRRAKRDPNNLLNIRVSKFVVHGRYMPENIISQMGTWAPELSSYIKTKALEYAAQKGIYPPGTAGSILSGGMEPQIDFEIQNVTVRQILNSLILYSRRNLGLFPIGWKYEFVIDPQAQNGLGGYPKWSTF